jgi:hypothetical protein
MSMEQRASHYKIIGPRRGLEQILPGIDYDSICFTLSDFISFLFYFCYLERD